jgi:hypothetical protein
MPKRSSSFKTTGRWTEDDARAALDAQARSGLAPTVFADREGLDPQRLTRWARRLADAGGEAPAFVEIGAGLPATLEVVLVSGLVLRVRESIAPQTLRELVEALGEGPC